MQTTTLEANVIDKTRELCQLILEQPEFRSMRNQIDAFLNNEEAKGAYQSLSEKGEYLQHKQAQGIQLSEEEVAEFQKHRDELFNNPVARGFMDAQQSIHKVQETVSQYVGKTFELGRVPEEADFGSGCGPSCGCGH